MARRMKLKGQWTRPRLSEVSDGDERNEVKDAETGTRRPRVIPESFDELLSRDVVVDPDDSFLGELVASGVRAAQRSRETFLPRCHDPISAGGHGVSRGGDNQYSGPIQVDATRERIPSVTGRTVHTYTYASGEKVEWLDPEG